MMKSIDFANEESVDPKQIKTALGCVNAINRIIESIGSQDKLRDKQ